MRGVRRRRALRYSRMRAVLVIVGVLVAWALVSRTEGQFLFYVVGMVLFPFLAFLVTLLFEGGPKRMVIYLRRFGNTGSAKDLTMALRRSLHRRYRIVTLDDDVFVPSGIVSWTRYWVLAGLLVAALLCALFWLVTQNTEASLGPTVILAQVFLVLTVYVALVALGTYVVHYIRLRREARQCVSIMDHIAQRRARVKELSAWVRAPSWMGPQTVVVAVENKLWQPTVLALCADATGIILDISTPGDGLAWEVDALLPAHEEKCILMGNHEEINTWELRAHDDPVCNRLERALRERTVLTYDRTPRGKRLLRANLFRALDNMPSQQQALGTAESIKLAARGVLTFAVSIIGVAIGIILTVALLLGVLIGAVWVARHLPHT